MFDFDDQVMHAISPHYYPKPRDIDPEHMRKKSCVEKMNKNASSLIDLRKLKLNVFKYMINLEKSRNFRGASDKIDI